MAKKQEATSKGKATLASKVLRNPNASKLDKALAGEVLRNAPDKPKPKSAPTRKKK